jgi:osmotically-inducible protein OsmY
VVALVYRPRRPLIHAGIVAVLLLLGAACTSVQNTREPASVAHVRVAADAELVARVKAALRADPYVNDTHIEVTMENGNVVLTGLVEDNRAMLDAVQIANKAADGRKVIDALSIMKTSAH